MRKIEKEVNWKYKIGENIKTLKKDVVIIDRQIRFKEYFDKRCGNKIRIRKEKHYKYHCNKCNQENWIIESTLSKDTVGCGICSNKVTIKGYNDIATTHPHLVKYFKNIKDAYTHTYASNDKIWTKCPNCGFEKLMIIDNLSKSNFNCSICSDKIPYGEKFVSNIFTQLGLKFKTQLTKSTFEWCKAFKYDFYFEYSNEDYICEVNGLQHYEENTNFEMTLDEQVKNDKLKKELALKNGIKEENYIVIDCRYSNLEWIKENILKSNLSKIFDLNVIDWLKAEEFTATSLIKQACDLKRNNSELSTTQIGAIMGYTKPTIRKWIEKGSGLGWCYYSKEQESQRNKSIGGKKRSKRVSVFKNGIYIDTFDSTIQLEELSEKLFGIKFPFRKISAICLGRDKNISDYTFKYE